MLTWLSANLSTLLISLVLFAVVISIVRYPDRNRQRHCPDLRMQRRLRRLFRRLSLRAVNTPKKEQAHGISRAPVFIIADLFTGWIPAPQKDQILTIFPVFHASVVA